MNNISLIKRAIAYMIDLYLGTLLSTIPISLTTYYQFHQISQDITLFSKPISSILLLLSIFALFSSYPIFLSWTNDWKENYEI